MTLLRDFYQASCGIKGFLGKIDFLKALTYLKEGKMETWMDLAPAFIIAGVALFIAFVGNRLFEKWRRRHYAPRLDFEFKYEAPHRHLTTMRRDITKDGKKVGDKYFPTYYFNFAVVNNGRSQADDCEAVLEEVWHKDSAGDWQPWKSFLVGINLRWAFGDPPERILKTIYPGRRVFCNIGRIEDPKDQASSCYRKITEEQKHQNKFFFESPHRLYVQADCLFPSKRPYKIRVSVYGKNAEKITRMFKVNWSGKWRDEKEEDIYKEIVIS